MGRFDIRDLFKGRTPQERIDALHLRPDLAGAAVLLVADERIDAQVARVEPWLTPQETVLLLVEGRYQRQFGLLVLTDDRVLFRPHGAGPTALTVLPLTDVSDVDSETGSMTGRVLLRSTGAVLEVDKLLGTLADQFATAVRQQQASSLARQVAPDGPSRDPLQELVELRDRYASGEVSSAEYEAGKARLVREI